MEEENESPRSEMEVEKHLLNSYLRVGPEEYKSFVALSTESERWTYMSSFSTIDFHSDNARSEILQEYLFHMLHFCMENHLNFQQMSAIVALSEALFVKCALNTDVQTADAKTIFRALVNQHIFSNEDPEASISIEVLKKLTTFCMQNFIRHLCLYQTVFSENQNETHEAKSIVVQTPMLFPSLMEATNYNGEEIGMDTARTEDTGAEERDTARSEFEQGDTARTDYTDYTEGEY